MSHAHLVFPHQLYPQHHTNTQPTHYILIEDDLYFRQYPFHAHKLILHRATMQHHQHQLTHHGHTTTYLATTPNTTSMTQLAQTLTQHNITHVTYHDPTDDWLTTQLTNTLTQTNTTATCHESPNFCTTTTQIQDYFNTHGARQHDFYIWQRKRLGLLLEGDQPVGGKWSFDHENRKKLPRGYTPPPVEWPAQCEWVPEAITYVQEHFPDAPGIQYVDKFRYPVTREAALAGLQDFLDVRFANFGPYEDAISTKYAEIHHSILTPALNVGLLDPLEVVHAAIESADSQDIPIASLEGFVRQVIGWREYMRATYVLWGRKMRSQNVLNHDRTLGASWWDGSTGLDPLDRTIQRLLETGYSHHIERLMLLGNMFCLLRIDPDEVYEWFMAMYIDSYDWVMVPNVYAMSQFACGDMITTKPYVSGSNYVKKMSDYGAGEWRDVWDGLYWTFVRDHRAVFESNHRSRMMVSLWDRMDDKTQTKHLANATPWLAGQQVSAGQQSSPEGLF